MRKFLTGRFLAVTLALAVAVPATAQDLTQPLTPEEVVCTELQLQRLLARALVVDEELPTNLVFAPGVAAGSYQGLLVVSQTPAGSGPVQPERQLAFHLNPVRSLLANPARPPLGQVALTREEPASNLTANPAQTAGVSLFPGSGGRSQPTPLDLVIDNISGPTARATSTRPGRGLEQDDLLTACTDRLTPFDLQIFALLQRLVKVETAVFFPQPQPAPSQITIFRGADPHVYRLNAYGGAPGKVAAEIRIEWTPDGRLTTAALHMLPACPATPLAPGCTAKLTTSAVETRILLVRPVLGGSNTWDRNAPGVGQLYHITSSSASWITDSTADLAALLADTAWNNGF
jgi:hypothetical protein